MATISVSLPSDGTTADVSDLNTPINTIVSEINGNLDNANIKTGAAISGAKLADASVTPAKRSGGFKVGVIPAATLGSTGVKAITGVGFTPKLVELEILTGTGTTTSVIIGTGVMTEDGDQYFTAFYSSDGSGQRKLSSTTNCIGWTNATISQLVASYSSMDADGFSINVVSANSSFDVGYKAYA